MNLDHVIDGLKKHDKVGIDYKGNYYVGYVESMTDRHLTIHEYVPDVYLTFNREDILEIVEFTGKLHKHVLADIRKEIEELGEEIGRTIFRPSSYINSNNEETTKTGGNEIMEKNNLQKQVEAESLIQYQENTQVIFAVSAMKAVVDADVPQDAVKEVLAIAIKDEPEQDFIDFPVNVHDGTGASRLQELYMHLDNGWKIERIQDNAKIDNHYYFTLVRSEDSPTVEEIKTKRTVDAYEIYEIAKVLENAILTDPPYILSELLSNGSEVPFEVTKEHFLYFHVNVAMEYLYNLLEEHEHLDDKGKMKE